MTTDNKKQICESQIFHPLKIVICGSSGSGKRTLIKKLMGMFRKNYRLGYVKYDAHTALGQNLLDYDMVFVEMLSQEDDPNHILLKKYLSSDRKDIVAVVGLNSSKVEESIPWFHCDDLDGISRFINNFRKSLIASRSLYGLVLVGGRSTRMGRDKAELSYHGKSQIGHICSLLDNFVDTTYISCRFEQKDSLCFGRYKTIQDRFLGFGPIGGILSAFQKHHQAAWIVVACDMPFIDKKSIEYLIEKRNPYRFATCFYNPKKKWPEPLFAIYEPKAAMRLGHYLFTGLFCPRKILANSRIEQLNPLSLDVLNNVNTPDEFKTAHDRIQTKEYSLENSLR